MPAYDHNVPQKDTRVETLAQFAVVAGKTLIHRMV